MQATDFSRSFVTFVTTPAQGGNIARIQIDATCRVEGWGRDGSIGEFHLIAPCRSERMYLDDHLFQMPNYEFCGIFAEEELVLLRTHWTSEKEEPEFALPSERFERIAIDIAPMNVEPLQVDPDVVKATLDNRRLVAQTILTDDLTGITATIEYPVKTMNVRHTPANYQVDTGPLLVPRFDALDLAAPLRFDVAHGVYWQSDRVEFILRKPHVVGQRDGQDVRVTDYTELRLSPSRNVILGEIR